jgi:hypothetical protein
MTRLHLYCPDGYSYEKPNRLKMFLEKDGEDAATNVTMEVARLWNVLFADFVVDWSMIVQRIEGQPVAALPGAESFTINDLSDSLSELFAVGVVVHDGEPLPGGWR